MTHDLRLIIENALDEDIGSGDITGNAVIPDNAKGKFVFAAREEMVFCGTEILRAIFLTVSSSRSTRGSSLDSRVEPENDTVFELFVKDGQKIPAGTKIAEIEGHVREILAKERVALNFIQHLSGVATETAKYVEAVKGTKAKILDTRKTIPGLRELQKYAVNCGGGVNHRMGLYDMVLIKDNHIAAAGGIIEAVAKAKSQNVKIEVECDTIEQAKKAMAAGVSIIMADNMELEELKEVVKLVAGKVPVEASGNVNLQTVRKIAETGVDFISTSKITMSARAVDIGLDTI